MAPRNQNARSRVSDPEINGLLFYTVFVANRADSARPLSAQPEMSGREGAVRSSERPHSWRRRYTAVSYARKSSRGSTLYTTVKRGLPSRGSAACGTSVHLIPASSGAYGAGPRHAGHQSPMPRLRLESSVGSGSAFSLRSMMAAGPRHTGHQCHTTAHAAFKCLDLHLLGLDGGSRAAARRAPIPIPRTPHSKAASAFWSTEARMTTVLSTRRGMGAARDSRGAALNASAEPTKAAKRSTIDNIFSRRFACHHL